MWSLHLEKALEDEKRSEDVSIFARDLSSVARVHDTISCSPLEITQPIMTNLEGAGQLRAQHVRTHTP